MKKSVSSIKSALIHCIKDLSSISSPFSQNPFVDFTRNRKLPFKHVITSLLCMSGGSTSNELMDYFNLSSNTPSSSAFVQQRSKILPEALETLFHMFNSSINTPSLYKGFRLLAVDGSDIHIPTNSFDKDSYYPGTNGQKPYNILHLNALYDLRSCTYVDAIVQKSRYANEHDAFIKMVDRFDSARKTIFMGDKGYESYNNMAHIQEKGHFFLIRVRNSTGGIANSLNLPNKDEFDIINNLYTVVNFILQYMEALVNSDEYPYLNGDVRKYDTNELEIYPLAIETALNIKLIGWKDDYLKEARYVIKQFKEKFDL